MSHMMRKRPAYPCLLLLLLLAFCGLLLCACAGEEESPLPPEALPSISRHSDYPVSADLSEMYAAADAVVIGQYLEFQEAWNMSRNPENPAEESTTDYFEGHFYSFAVEEVLKGQAEDEIRINIPYQRRYSGEVPELIFDEQGQAVGRGEGFDAYEFDALWEFYMEPDLEERYILFLSYNAEEDRYFPAIEPYVIALSEDGRLELRSNLLLPEAERAEKFQTQFRTESGKPMLFEIAASPIEDQISGMTLEEFLLELESPAENAAPEQPADE